MGTGTETARRAELADNLAALERRIIAACAAATRPRTAVTLVAVTKFHPASDLALLRELGVVDVGESRDQEASVKAAALAGSGLRWHFVGQLQSNKAASVAGYADVVHSVDRASLVQALDAGASKAGRRLDVLVQVSLDGATDRSGVLPADAPALAAAVAASESLRLRGVMAVAPLGEDPSRAFARLAQTAAALRADHPAADLISAGMSGDLEQAVAAGATHLRVGTALLGPRTPPGG